MLAQRVLIFSSQTLFAESLASLLQDHGCEIIGVHPFDDAALMRVTTEQPSVVILDAHALPPSAPSAMLDCAANIRILEVSLDSSMIALYHRHESSATVQHFLDLVTGGGVQSFDAAQEIEPGTPANHATTTKI